MSTMNKIDRIFHYMMNDAKYQHWSRVGGMFVANVGAYYIVKTDMQKDLKGVPKKMEWRDAYYASLLHMFATVVGGVIGPILPVLPILAAPGILYKLTDTTPETTTTGKDQMK